MKRENLILAVTVAAALLFVPFNGHRHSVPEKSFATVHAVSAPLSPYDSIIRSYADSIGWDWRLIAALIRQESRFNSKVISPGGAVGLMQVQSARYSQETLMDPEQNIRIGTRYLKKLEQMFSAASRLDTIKFALSAYNMGDGRLSRLMADAAESGKDPRQWEEVVPLWHQSRRYVNSILRLYDHYLLTQPSALRLRVLSDTIPMN
ncbi:MAG: transglycosylase SLT domain-containing protein [Bacteroidales bacterium]|nr:transglycosylase SLT domain-containing protein [Bacteroidales bacterium]